METIREELVFSYKGPKEFIPVEEINKFVVEGYRIDISGEAGDKYLNVKIIKCVKEQIA